MWNDGSSDFTFCRAGKLKKIFNTDCNWNEILIICIFGIYIYEKMQNLGNKFKYVCYIINILDVIDLQRLEKILRTTSF